MPSFHRKCAAVLCALFLAGVCADGSAQVGGGGGRGQWRGRGRMPGAERPAAGGSAVVNAGALTDREVLAGINKGVDALLIQMNQDLAAFRKSEAGFGTGQNARRHRRGDDDDYLAGSICLSIDALLTVGRITGDPRLHFTSKEMAPAISFLESLRTDFTYTLALQATSLSLLPNRPDVRKPLTDVRNELLTSALGSRYTYHNQPEVPLDSRDNSNTQYGELGTWACREAGLEVPTGYWEAANIYWRGTQLPGGDWGYYPSNAGGRFGRFRGGGRASMTAAGVASLFLIQDQLDHSVNIVPKPDKVLDAGIQWLGDNFATYCANLSDDLYLAYGIERVALAGGLKTLGTHDWYREGAALLIAAQHPDGSWNYDRGSPAVSSGTAYALLFLARGIAPVACAKLQYDGPWNARARDCARFVHWLSNETEKTLNWQTISLASDPAGWRNVPVLVITGHGDPKFTREQIAKLRTYVQNGGLIFSSADEANAAFTKAIREKYAPALFGNIYEMRALLEDHPVYQLDFKEATQNRPHLLGLSNGIREVWIHSPEDITATWQTNNTLRTQFYEIPANIYFYATGRIAPPIRLDPLTPPKPPPATVTYNIARVMYAGNWDPEPAAWDHFAAYSRQHYAAIINTVPTPIADLDVAKTPIAHITGTTAFTLTALERQKLADFISHGGRLLADAAGGSEAFAASFKSVMAQIYPDAPLAVLPPKNPVLTGDEPGGARISVLDTRRFTDFPENRARSIALMAIEQNGKPVALFSNGDLTAGITGLATWGILGYAPQVTDALVWNGLLYLAPPPPPAPPVLPAAPASATPFPGAASAPHPAATVPASRPASTAPAGVDSPVNRPE